MVEIRVPGSVWAKTPAGWAVPLPPRESDKCKMVVWLPPQKSTVDRRNQCVLLRLTPAEYYGQYDLMVTPESNRVVGDIHNIRAEVLVRRYQFQTQTRAA